MLKSEGIYNTSLESNTLELENQNLTELRGM